MMIGGCWGQCQTALQRAIVMRMLCRDALDRDDMCEVARLNRLADQAYVDMTEGHGTYSAWAHGEMTDEELKRILYAGHAA